MPVRLSTRARICDEAFLGLTHERVDQAFELAQGSRVPSNDFGKASAIDALGCDGVRKARGDRRGACPARSVERVYRRIGVENRKAEPSEQLRRLALAHADRAGETDAKGGRVSHGALVRVRP